MTGGNIVGNTATENGGGVYVNEEDATFAMEGGTITGNTASSNGGGVYVSEEKAACLAAGTPITLADGTRTAIENLKKGDMVRVFDHETGEISSAKLFDLWKYPAKQSGAFTLHFTHGIDVTAVGGHCFFDKAEKRYVAIDTENVNDYIGHEFYNVDDACWETLTGVTFLTEAVDTYIIVSEKHMNVVAGGMLSNEDGIYTLMSNIFAFGENLTIDAAAKAEDIAQFGLWDFENVQYVSQYVYDALNLQYMSVAFGKGLITPERFAEIGAYSAEIDPELLCSGKEAENAPPQKAEAKESLLTKVVSFLTAPFVKTAHAVELTKLDAGGVYFGGTAQVVGNKANKEGHTEKNNVYLCSGEKITLGTKTGDSGEAVGNGVAAPSGMSVGVTTADVPASGNPVQVTAGSSTSDTLQYFTPDNSNYYLGVKDSKLYLSVKPIITVAKHQNAANPVYGKVEDGTRQLFDIEQKDFIPTATLRVEWEDGASWTDVLSAVGLALAPDGKVTTSATTPAGNYTFRVTNGATGTNLIASKPVKLTVNPAEGSVTAPTAKELTYNGQAQELVNAGTSTTGEVKYAVSKNTVTTAPTDWSAEIPTGKDADTYRVWYKVMSGSNHKAVSATYTDVTVQPRPVTLVADSGSKMYDGGPLTCPGYTVKMSSGTDCGFVEGEGIDYVTMTGGSTITEVGSVLNEIDTYRLKAGTLESNYVITTENGTLTVTEANGSVTVTPKNDLVYTGEMQELIESDNNHNTGTIYYATSTDTVTTAPATADCWGIDKPAAVDAGTIRVWYKLTGDNNHFDVAATYTDVTIARADGSIAVTPASGLIYNEAAQDLVTAAAGTGTITYATTTNTVTEAPDSWSTATPTAIDAGTTRVWYKLTGDKNHNSVDATYTDVTIAPKDVSDSAALAGIVDKTYTGSALTQDITVTDGAKTLSGGTDYTVTYASNINAGTATVTITFQGNYTGATHTDFTVEEASITNVSVAQSGTLTYNGGKQTATVTKAADTVNSQQTTFTYATATNGEYSASVPGFTDADTYTVYYKVTAPNHETAAGSFTVTINPKQLIATDTVVADKVYDATTKATVTDIGTFTNLESVDDGKVSLSAVASFTDKAAGNSKAAVVVYTISGERAGNYIVPVNGTVYADIDPKPITAQWTGTSKVYNGTEQSPEYNLLGVCQGDTVAVTNTETDAGSYRLTAALNNSNYTLTNPNVNFVIEKAPVRFTVTNDSHQYDAGEKSATITASPSNVGFTTIYKDSSGRIVAAPKAVGNYGIFVALTNDNYRHADAPDGKERRIGTLTIYQSSAPATYTVSFSGGDGATGTMTDLPAVKAGNPRTLPACGFTRETWTFVGWKYGSRVYQAGDSFTQPSANVTFTAQWTQDVYTVSGVVYNSALASQTDAVVKLMSGARQVRQAVTNTEGAFTFTAVLPGLYNLVTSYDGITVTTAVEITDGNVSLTVQLPGGRMNSIVEVAPGTPEVVVGGLNENFTTEDDDVVSGGGSVELKLAVSEIRAPEQSKQAALEKKSRNEFLYLDMDLTKTTVVDDVSTTTDLYTTDKLMVITVPIPADLQGKDSYQLYRFHSPDGTAANEKLTAMKQLSGTGTPTEEGFRVSGDKTAITVYTQSFSLYALTYTQNSHGGSSYTPGHTVTSDLNNVTKVTIDGKVVDKRYYTVTGGTVYLTGEFIRTLTNGKHTVKLYDGIRVATGIMNITGNANVVSAPTGDMGLALYGALTISSLLGMGWVGKKKH